MRMLPGVHSHAKYLLFDMFSFQNNVPAQHFAHIQNRDILDRLKGGFKLNARQSFRQKKPVANSRSSSRLAKEKSILNLVPE